MELKPHEIDAILKTPDALDLLADWHEVQLTQADAMNDAGVYDGSIKYHEARQQELRAEDGRLFVGEKPYRVPLLFMFANLDLVAPPDVVASEISRLVAPERNTVVCARSNGFTTDFAHADIISSRAAVREVYPLILHWLENIAESKPRAIESRRGNLTAQSAVS